MIYFIRALGTDRIKIGYTAGDPMVRLRALQTGCPFKLELVATTEGTQRHEREAHTALEALRCEGEWFQIAQADLADAVDDPKFLGRCLAARAIAESSPRLDGLRSFLAETRDELADLHDDGSNTSCVDCGGNHGIAVGGSSNAFEDGDHDRSCLVSAISRACLKYGVAPRRTVQPWASNDCVKARVDIDTAMCLRHGKACFDTGGES